MKTRLFIFLFLAHSLFPGLLFAQFNQQGPKLVGTGAIGNQVYMGYSVAISSDGSTAIVGGESDNGNIGAVWIYIRSNGVWTQQGPKLVGTGNVGGSHQGFSVALSADGNTAVVGGRLDNNNAGAVWVFTRSNGVWTQQGSKLIGSGAAGSSQQGVSVSVSADGNTIVSGGWVDNVDIGAFWIFTRTNGVWSQLGQKLTGSGSAGSAKQGRSVAISADGNTIIEGGITDNNGIGAVWIFTRSGGTWIQQGSKLTGTGYIGSLVYQGESVAVSSDGNTLLIGAPGDNINAGASWIFTRTSGIWIQQGSKIVGTGAVGSSQQGWYTTISSDGNTAVVGGFADNTGAGAVWVFTRNTGLWSQLGQKLVGTGAVGSANQGVSVAISSDGNTIIEGGHLDNGNQGAVWIFTRANYRFSNTHHNLNKLILGNQITADTILVGTEDISSYYVSNVNVTLDSITYPVDSDLEISLINSATTDTLVYQLGGNGANFTGTVLSDSAGTSISNGTPPFTGNFRPGKPLSQFINSEPAGTWIIRIYDRNNLHTGILEAWTLTIDLVQNPISVRTISTGMPKGFSLMQNYPNPFNPETRIKFDIPASSNAKIILYDITGRTVGVLLNGNMAAGSYEINFNAASYSSGVYFYKLVSGDFVDTKKMVLVK